MATRLFPPGAVRPTAVLITVEQSQPFKLGLQVVTRSEFFGRRERRTGYERTTGSNQTSRKSEKCQRRKGAAGPVTCRPVCVPKT